MMWDDMSLMECEVRGGETKRMAVKMERWVCNDNGRVRSLAVREEL